VVNYEKRRSLLARYRRSLGTRLSYMFCTLFQRWFSRIPYLPVIGRSDRYARIWSRSRSAPEPKNWVGTPTKIQFLRTNLYFAPDSYLRFRTSRIQSDSCRTVSK